MAKSKTGCGCAVAALAIFLLAVAAAFLFVVRPWWKSKQLPPPSGKELQVHVLDVGEGDAILIISPEGKSVLIDAGDTGRGKIVLDAMNRYHVTQLDYFIATHAHTDHIGGADEVLNAVKVLNVIDNGVVPASVEPEEWSGNKNAKPKPSGKSAGKTTELPTTKAFLEFTDAVKKNGSEFSHATPGQKYDLGGGAILTVLAPITPFFTREQMRSGGGNEPNANSVVVRLDYGEFSMLFAGDAETQTEERMMNKSEELIAKVLKVGHHGSKYASSENFLKAVKPEVALISDADANRYGHPAQDVLDRLKAVGAKLYRTDLQGELTITTTGKTQNGKLYEVKTGREAKGDVWAGREPQKDDSDRAGFIAYGDYGPPPKREKQEKKAKASSWNANQ
ncbi:MAG TPA: ComEC/Rec2 family competence protein [Pyrinomonadaceae bacterium]|jgi:beta-lactamase superfamily II metal-dependent hydrolase